MLDPPGRSRAHSVEIPVGRRGSRAGVASHDDEPELAPGAPRAEGLFSLILPRVSAAGPSRAAPPPETRLGATASRRRAGVRAGSTRPSLEDGDLEQLMWGLTLPLPSRLALSSPPAPASNDPPASYGPPAPSTPQASGGPAASLRGPPAWIAAWRRFLSLGSGGSQAVSSGSGSPDPGGPPASTGLPACDNPPASGDPPASRKPPTASRARPPNSPSGRSWETVSSDKASSPQGESDDEGIFHLEL